MADSLRVLTTLECGGSASTERIMEAQAVRDHSMTSYLVSKKTMEVHPQHSTMTELKKQAAADQSDKTVKHLIWPLFDTSLLTSGFILGESTQFASRIHRVIAAGLSIDYEDKGFGLWPHLASSRPLDELIPDLPNFVQGAADSTTFH